ncbi:MAG: 6-phosphogluconolactonase, partial [Pseudomonadota bacterium]
ANTEPSWSMFQPPRVDQFESIDALTDAAVDLIIEAAESAIEERARFTLVLAGGSTPQRVYEALKGIATDWSRWHFYIGDERCVPRGDPLRNDLMAREAWLDHCPVNDSQVYPMPAELGPDEGAQRYSEVVADVDVFDLVLLGLGEDGHTASLFPGHQLGEHRDSPGAIPVRNSPKPPPERVSLSAYRISQARQVVLLVSGEAKAAPLKSLVMIGDTPVNALKPKNGLLVLCDAAAASQLPVEQIAD